MSALLHSCKEPGHGIVLLGLDVWLHMCAVAEACRVTYPAVAVMM